MAKQKKVAHPYPFWSPRMWHGMLPADWVRLLAQNGFRIHPTRWPLAFSVSLFTSMNWVLRTLQTAYHGNAVRQTEIKDGPIFILGHWRSGTTFLHELMVRDDRYAYPTTLECFAPHHCLLTGDIFSRWFNFMLPKSRPMDNMPLGWERPQEDEFALLALGMGTPMLDLAFPKHDPAHLNYLDMQGLSPKEIEQFKRSLIDFVRMLTYRKHKPLIMKSPPHTGRVGLLAETFPKAKFVHIARDPMAVVPSTLRLWRTLHEVQSLQLPPEEEQREFVFQCYERMYGGFESQRQSLPPERICDVRYEDLVPDPVGQVERIYEQLDLGDFSAMREKLQPYLERVKDYKPNRHQLDPELKAAIQDRWADYIARYGY